MKNVYRFDEIRPVIINLSRIGDVTTFSGVGGNSNYNPIVGYASNLSEAADEIYGFMKREKGKDLILRALIHKEPFSNKTAISELELRNIGENLIKKGLNVRALSN